jgi:hypothetical protein
LAAAKVTIELCAFQLCPFCFCPFRSSVLTEALSKGAIAAISASTAAFFASVFAREEFEEIESDVFLHYSVKRLSLND